VGKWLGEHARTWGISIGLLDREGAHQSGQSMMRQMAERKGPVVAHMSGCRSWTSGRGGPVHPGEPPGSSSSAREGWSMTGIDEPVVEEAATGEQHFQVVLAGNSG
jgi:hypothetical protein